MLRRNSEESINEDMSLTELQDPILFTPYSDPVLASDGYVYERAAILQHLESKNPASPFTREAISRIENIPEALVKKLKKITEEYHDKQKEWIKKLKENENKLAADQKLIKETTEAYQHLSQKLLDSEQRLTKRNEDIVDLEKALEKKSDELNQHLRNSQRIMATHNNKLTKLEKQLTDSHQQILCHEASYYDLQKKLAESLNLLAKREEELKQTKLLITPYLNLNPHNSTSEIKSNTPLTQSFLNSRFLKAMSHKDLQKAVYYLKEGASINAINPDGNTALMIAIQFKKENPELAQEAMRLLSLDFELNINKKASDGNTALHHAVMINDLWACQFLLANGANPLITNNLNQTPLNLGKLLNKSFDKDIENLLKTKENEYGNSLNKHSIFSEKSQTSPAQEQETEKKGHKKLRHL